MAVCQSLWLFYHTWKLVIWLKVKSVKYSPIIYAAYQIIPSIPCSLTVHLIITTDELLPLFCPHTASDY